MAKKKGGASRVPGRQPDGEDTSRVRLLQDVPVEEERGIDELVAHPLQPLYFDPLSDQALDELADDIRRNGLHNRVEILPENLAGLAANTVLDGHMRWLALMRLGRATVPVLVNYNLAAADASTVERAFLEKNKNRRHLDKLAQARLALRLFEIERGRPRGGLHRLDEREGRDRVGKAIGMSGRNLHRYFRVLKAPVELQRAFQAGKLSLVEAGKVAGLEPEVQSRIAERIRAGEDPRKTLTEAYDRVSKYRSPSDAFRISMPVLARIIRELRKVANEVPVWRLRADLRTLAFAQEIIGLLIARSEQEEE